MNSSVIGETLTARGVFFLRNSAQLAFAMVMRFHNLRKCILAIFFLLTAINPQIVRAQIQDRVFEGVPGLSPANHFVVFILGADDWKDAHDKFKCMRKTNPAIPFGVFRFKDPDMTGYITRPYAFLAGSYETFEEAKNTFIAVRDSINYEAFYQCLTDEIDPKKDWARDAMSFFEIRTYAELVKTGLAVDLPEPPNYDVGTEKFRSPLAPFDAIGTSRYVAGSDSATAVVFYRPVASADDARNLLDDFQARAADIHFAVIKYGGLYYVTMAAQSSSQSVQEALLAVYRRGLYEFGVAKNIPPLAQVGTTAQTPLVVNFDSRFTVPDLPSSVATEKSDSTIPTVIERASLSEPVINRVERCFGEIIKANSQATPTSDQVSACAGVILTPKMLTRCMVQSTCQGIAIPVQFTTDPKIAAKACLDAIRTSIPDPATNNVSACQSGSGYDDCVSGLVATAAMRCEATTLDRPFVNAIIASGLGTCLSDPTGHSCATPYSKLKLFCDGDGKAICDTFPASTKSLAIREAQLNRCLSSGKCDAIVPRFGYTQNEFAMDIARMGQVSGADDMPAVAGIQFLQDPSSAAKALLNCQKKRDGGDASAKNCFVQLGLNDSETPIFQCLTSAGNSADAVSNCLSTASPNVSKLLVQQGNCLKSGLQYGLENLDATKLANCQGVDTSALALALTNANCARMQTSAAKVLENCSGVIAPAVTSTLTCAASTIQGGDPVATYTSCLPDGLGDKKTAALCLAQASDDQQRFGCISAFVGAVNPEVQNAIACANLHAADVSSDPNGKRNAIASCISPGLVPSSGLQTAASTIASCVNNPAISGDPIKLASCLPDGFGDKLGAAKCITSAPDDVARKACASQLLGNIPPSLQQTITCANEFENSTPENVGSAVATCVANSMLPPIALQSSVLTAVKCAKTTLQGDAAISAVSACLPDGFGDKAAAAQCIGGTTDDQARLACLSTFLGNVDPQIQQLTACANQAASDNEATSSVSTISECIASKLLPSQAIQDALQIAVKCTKTAVESSDTATALAACLPDGLGDKADAANCIATAASDSDRLACVANFVGNVDPKVQQAIVCAQQNQDAGDASQVAAGIAACLAKNYVPDNITQMAQCLADKTDDIDRAACLGAAAGVDPKTVSAAACLAKSGGDTEAMAMCAVAAFLPPQFARIAQCASQATGDIDFAICVSGASLNPELRVAAQCASDSGGDPLSFAACTAGTLTVKELEKCMQGQIGGDGCFGSNNSLVQAMTGVAGVLSQVAGQASKEVDQALTAITQTLSNDLAAVGSGFQNFVNQVSNTVSQIFSFSWL